MLIASCRHAPGASLLNRSLNYHLAIALHGCAAVVGDSCSASLRILSLLSVATLGIARERDLALGRNRPVSPNAGSTSGVRACPSKLLALKLTA